MAERSFAVEVGSLRLGEGEEFRGEGILAITKALLQSGVAYVGGYQGAPVSHLMDVLGDAQDILDELGVHFESSANEAAAAAMLAASVSYPLRGAVTFKSVVGVNVASDALSNLASGGVKGGALIIIGEDYGEGSSIMQERVQPFAMKSQIWLMDPRPDVARIVECVEKGFELSEASNTPVMLEVRIRACHVHGRFRTKANVAPAYKLIDALNAPVRDPSRIVLPPMSYAHEKEKIEKRWPAAVRFIVENALNEVFPGDLTDIGIVCQGGMYNGVVRALETVGLSDAFGNTRVPIYCLNVTYPLVAEEVVWFAEGKRALLIVEEGQPELIEQAVNTILRRADIQTKVHGKDMLPMAGELTGGIMRDGVRAFVRAYQPAVVPADMPGPSDNRLKAALALLDGKVHARPPSFCTGCPERPIFTAMKLVERETGPHHVSSDIGCHLFAILPPFNIGTSTMGYGLGPAAAAAFNVKGTPERPVKRAISMIGDGGFWHNGLSSSVGNAVFNKSDNVIMVVDNGYSAATGGQDILSTSTTTRVAAGSPQGSRHAEVSVAAGSPQGCRHAGVSVAAGSPQGSRHAPERSTGNAIEKAVRGIGVTWARTINPTYDLKTMMATLKEALTTKEPGPKVIVAQSECMLNRQRRERPLRQKALADGQRVVRERFGVDHDTCTGDHSCIRLSGCPSLTIAPHPDPLRKDPVTKVVDSCVGCGLCGEVAHAAVLCPSFYRASIIANPTRWERLRARWRAWIISRLQARIERRLEAARG
jgi:indolepyruvate ferredoxin oxidoreductase alpha subunit